VKSDIENDFLVRGGQIACALEDEVISVILNLPAVAPKANFQQYGCIFGYKRQPPGIGWHGRNDLWVVGKCRGTGEQANCGNAFRDL
jgi:hypothetical protein